MHAIEFVPPALIVFSLIFPVQAANRVPKILNYQARVTDAGGVQVPDGSLSVKFVFYDSLAGGNCLYSVSGTCGTPTAKTVTVTNGVFSTLLGDTGTGDNEVPDTLFDNDAVFLGITISADSEMSPRKRVSASPYSLNADKLDDLDATSSGSTTPYIVATTLNGNLMITGDPQGSGVSQGSVSINPAGTSADETIFGVADNGSSRFRIDKEGDITIQGSLNADAASSTAQFVIRGAALHSTDIFEIQDVNTNRLFSVSSTSTQYINRLLAPAHGANQGLQLPTNAGTPGAVSGTVEGDIVWDATNNHLYVFNGGTFAQIDSVAAGATNLNQAYLASTGSPEIALSSSIGAVTIADTMSGTGNIFEITDRTTANGDFSRRYFTVSSTSTTITNTLVAQGDLTVTGSLAANGAFTLGNGGSTGSINTSDWDISASGDLTGVNFDANGSGNSVSNIESADILDGTVTGDDIASSLAGLGLVLTAGSPDVLDLDLINVIDGAGATSNNSGFEFGGTGAAQVGMLQGCADSQILKWNDGTSVWACATDATGASTNLNQAYLNSTSTAEISLSSTIGAVTIADTFSGTSDIFEIQDRTTSAGDYSRRYFTVSSTSTLINAGGVNGYNVGIGNAAPSSRLTVGSSTSTFEVDANGNLVKVNNVPYSWPSSQGGASTVLTNNGSGLLTWSAGGGGGTATLQTAYDSSTGTTEIFLGVARGALTLADSFSSFGGNLFEIQDRTNGTGDYSKRFFTASSTSTQVTGGSRLIVGSTNTLIVNSSGNFEAINGIVTRFPSAQGANNQVLTNDGSGNLTWTTAAAGSATMQQTYDNDPNGGDTTITTNSTDGDIIIAGDQDFRVTTTALTVFGNNTHTTTNPVTINASTLTSGTLLALNGGGAMTGTGMIVSATGTVNTGPSVDRGLFNLQANMTQGTGGGGSSLFTTGMNIDLNDISNPAGNSVAGYNASITMNSFTAHTQYGYRANLLANSGSPVDNTLEALYFANTADTATGNQITVTNGFQASVSGGVVGMTNGFNAAPSSGTITNGFAVSGATVTNGINFTGGSAMTTDFIMQNAESIENNTDGVINTSANSFQVTPVTATIDAFILNGNNLTSGDGLFLNGGGAISGNGTLINATGTIASGPSSDRGLFNVQANMRQSSGGGGTSLYASGMNLDLNDISNPAGNSVAGYNIAIVSNAFTAHTQYGYRANLTANSGSPSDNTWEALFFADSADTATGNQITVTNGFQASVNGGVVGMTNGFNAAPSSGTITNGFAVSGATVTNGINFTGGSAMTTDFIMQNGESIENNVDGVINTSANSFQVTPVTATIDAFIINGNNLTTGDALFINGGGAMTTAAALINATGTVSNGPSVDKGLFTVDANLTFSGGGGGSSLFQSGMLVNMNDIGSGGGNSSAGYDLEITSNKFAAHTQYGHRVNLLANAGSPTDNTWEALMLLNNADTATGNLIAVTDALLITNTGAASGGIVNAITIGSGTQPITTALNIASTGITNDIRLQNGEVIHNDTDGTIAFTDGTNTLCTIIDGGTTGSLSCTGGITGSTSLNQAYGNSTSTTEIFTNGTQGALTIADTLSGTGNIFEIQDRTTSAGDFSRRYFTISSTSTQTTSQFLTGAGSAGAPSHSFAGDPDTGMYSNGANSLGFSIGGTQWLTLNTAGFSSIASHFDINGELQFDLNGSGDTTTGVCKSTADTGDLVLQPNVTLVDCNGTPGDIAEWYPTDGTASAGDIVVATDEELTYHSDAMDPLTGLDLGFQYQQAVSVLKKSSGTYAARVLGVVSTNPVQTFGMGVNDATSSTAPIALNGRVPTKVNLQNGAIKVGDPITTSSVAGVGMKATKPGMVVGYALQAWNGPGQGVIEVFVKPVWHSALTIGTDGIVSFFNDDFTFSPKGTSSASARSFDSFGLTFKASAWDPGSSTAVTRNITILNETTDPSTYQLAFKDDQGSTLASLNQSGDLSIAGSLTVNGGFDYAETFPSAPDLDAGDLVMVDSENATGYGVKKSDKAYENSLVGIISTKPGFLTGKSGAGTQPVALAGRVPVKVNTEGGEIKAGDPITSSSTPGVGMKATKSGMIVGTALSDWKGPGQGTILLFLNVGWRSGNGASEVLAPAILTVSASGTPMSSPLTSLISANGLWSISSDGVLMARTVKTDVLQTEEIVVVQSAAKSAISEGKIPAGKSSMVIKNGAMKADSKIFVTFMADANGNYWITDKGDGVFTIHLKAAPKKDLPFEYWIVGVDDQRPTPGPAVK